MPKKADEDRMITIYLLCVLFTTGNQPLVWSEPVYGTEEQCDRAAKQEALNHADATYVCVKATTVRGKYQ